MHTMSRYSIHVSKCVFFNLKCTVYSAGYACPNTTLALEIPCSSGYFAIGMQTSCTACPAGFACPSTTSSLADPCNAGEYSLGGLAACHTCSSGYACPSRSASPVICLAGTYAPTGQLAWYVDVLFIFVEIVSRVQSVFQYFCCTWLLCSECWCQCGINLRRRQVQHGWSDYMLSMLSWLSVRCWLQQS
jgi:hypothetical protein